ncbi:MAG: DinB family protein [Bacillota bacterium]|nr:DinB family protein [Bacillota bacterium]
MSKAAELAAKLLTQRVETIEQIKNTPSTKLGVKNADGRPMRAVMRIMHDHEMSHLVQVQKTLQAIGHQPTEVQMILAQTMQARAALAAAILSLSDEQLEAKPSPDTWSVREVLEHIVRYDPVLIERIKTQFEGAD